VTLRFDTGGVAALVYDEQGALLGGTADAGGIVLAHGTAERVVKLRAEGHEELALKVVPNEDRSYPAPLQRIPEVRPATKKGGKTTKPPAKSDPEPDPRPGPGPATKPPDESGVSPDLIPLSPKKN